MANKPEESILSRAVGAMLGVACGDALGWPNERASRYASDKNGHKGTLAKFRKWTRRSGSRYYPYEEIIQAGTYSDDTQLILCMARSLQYGEQWQDRFCRVELPIWTLYERGGGGATKRSADAWATGVPPWSEERKKNEVSRYFDAGGNGVAMRILPHALFKAEQSTFEPVACNILLDGTATHGHPRALVGALCYGYALWQSFRKTGRLIFGGVVKELLDHSEDWGAFPKSEALPKGWLDAADKQVSDYQGLWDAAVGELTQYLKVCHDDGISKGALAADDKVLRSIQCFDRKVNGAGTVAAAAAAYLASRYAPEPMNGVIKAAYATGADTDTIASMTGGLLGAISGDGWLFPLKADVQDSEYLQRMAKVLVAKCASAKPAESSKQAIKPQLNQFKDSLAKFSPGESLNLPDGRHGKIVSAGETIGKTGKFKAVFCRIALDDGQSLEVSKLVKGSFINKQPSAGATSASQAASTLKFGTKLPTRELNKAVRFYEEILGLEIDKERKKTVTFKQGLVLVSGDYLRSEYEGADIHTMFYIEVSDIEGRFSKVKEDGIKIVTPLSAWKNTKRSYFRCSDPDGNIIEVFSSAGQ